MGTDALHFEQKSPLDVSHICECFNEAVAKKSNNKRVRKLMHLLRQQDGRGVYYRPKALLAKPSLPKGGGTALAVGGFLKRCNINL